MGPATQQLWYRGIARLLVLTLIVTSVPAPPLVASAQAQTPPPATTTSIPLGNIASATPPFTLGGYVQVGVARVSRTVFDFTYTARLTHGGASPAFDVVAQLTSSTPATQVIDGSVAFGDVPAGATVPGRDTFTIRQDRSVAFDPTKLVWSVTQNHPPAITSAGIAPQWTQLAPVGASPPPRAYVETRGYDHINDRLIVFGGDTFAQAHLNDVWVLENATGLTGIPAWKQLAPTGGPPTGRHLHSAVYDPTANRLIVHGGCAVHCAQLSDTWVLTNANGLGGNPEWLSLPPSGPLAGHAAGYDPLSNRMIVFGGYTGPGRFSDTNLVRVLVDANGLGNPHWVTLSPSGSLPAPRGRSAVAEYDSISNRLIVFAGGTSEFASPDSTLNDVWVLTHANGLGGTPEWIRLDPQGVAPAPRAGHSLSYDANSGRLIVVAGSTLGETTFFREVWALANANGLGGTPKWLRIESPDGSVPPITFHASGYNAASNRLVIAFGYSGDPSAVGASNAAWLLTNASGLCTAGQPCAFKATATDPDTGDALSYALDAAPAGMTIDTATGAMLWTPSIAQIGNHAVTVRVTDRGGLSATQTFTATVVAVAVPNVVGLAPEWAESFITAADLTVGTRTSQGGAITLNFDSLPSRQGWAYKLINNTVSESAVFSASGGLLSQDTMGTGFQGQGSIMYVMANPVDKRLPLGLDLRARVIADEGAVTTNSFGFGIDAQTGAEFVGIGIGAQRVHDIGNRPLVAGFDNTQFHQYGVVARPGSGYQLQVDGALVGTGPMRPLTPEIVADLNRFGLPANSLLIGDLTGGTNARAEVTAYSFTQPRVVGQNPPAGTLVPNKTAVDLTIVDGPATETVPSLTGLSQAEARAAILAANLTVGAVNLAPSTAIPAGQVSDQSPLPNIRVPKSTPVNIVMSTGPPGPVNLPPTITSTPVNAATAGQPYSYQVTATDPNAGDLLTYSLIAAPQGLTIDAATGLIQWVPTEAHVGTQAVSVRVTDRGGLTATQDFTIVVAPPNHPPAISSAGIAPQWTQLAPTGTPPTPRAYSGADAYDWVNDRLILFGGSENGATLPHLNDVWVLENATGAQGAPRWVKLAPGGGPPGPRVYHSASYDPTANRLIVFGGGAGNLTPVYSDAWVLTNANGFGGPPEWLSLPSGPAIGGHAASYDVVSNRLVVFGGMGDTNGSDTNSVHVLVDANGIGSPRWEALATTGAAPPPRGEIASAAYDATTNRLIVVGGRQHQGRAQFNDVWVLTNANGTGGAATWIQLAPDGVPPSPRGMHSLAYDPNMNRLILFGGMDTDVGDPYLFFNDTWVLSNANGLGGTPAWSKIETGATIPAARGWHSIGYSRRANKMVVTAGRNDRTPVPHFFNDVWVLSNASGNCSAGQPCTFKATATDPDTGDALSYALDAAPAGMTIDAATGAIVWTPAIAQIGNHTVTVRVTDRGGLSATQAFTATVAPVAVPNVVGLAPEWAESFITAADLAVGTKTSQGGAITLNFNSLPSRQGWAYWAQNNSASETKVFQVAGGTLFQNSLGTGFQGQGSNRYNFYDVVGARLPMQMALRARVLEEEGAIASNSYGFSFGEFTGSASIGNGLGTAQIMDQQMSRFPYDNTLFHQYRLEARPGVGSRLMIDDALALTGSDVSFVFRNHLYLGDGTGGTNARAEVTAYSFTQPRVVGQNPPAGTLVPNKTAVDLTIVDGPATETVPSLTGLSQAEASAAILAANLAVGAVNSAPSTTIPAGQVSDQSPLPSIHVPKSMPVNIVMSTGPPGPVNLPPSITSTPVNTASAGQPYSYPVTATDPNLGDILAYSLPTAPAGMTINSSSGLIAWTPTDGQIGTHAVNVRVTDPGGLSAEQNFVVTVSVRTNRAPAFTTTAPTTATVGQPYAYDADATDLDGDTVSYALASAPTGMSIDAATGLVQWTPTVLQAGNQNVEVRAQDAAGAFALQAFVIVVGGGPQPTVSVPNVVGLTQAAAQSALLGANLNVGTTTSASSNSVPAGNVISQNPAAATVVALGSPVSLVISTGPAPANVPNVVGLAQTAAQSAIVNAGLAVGTVTQQASDTVPAGTVISQNPAAGAVVTVGSAVNLVVSAGPAQVTVPNVVGQPEAAAVAALTSAGLTQGSRTTQSSTTVPAGSVISQNPAAGASVPRGSPVALVVSSGTQLVPVPDVVGATQTNAQAALIAAGLTVGAVSQQPSSSVPAGSVISQNPAANAQVAAGSAVALVVSSGSAQSQYVSIVLSPVAPTITTGSSQQFSATGILANGSSRNITGQVGWTSSDPAVAFAGAPAGLIGAAAAGTATISASLEGVTGSTLLTVVPRMPNGTPPIAEITSPADQDEVIGPVAVTGTASDPEFLKYILEIAPVGDPNYTPIAESTTPVSGGTLGTLDPTVLINDLYNLRLRVFDRGGIFVVSPPVQVQVKRERKVGNFTLAFQDANIPYSCLPVTVTRIYDSRDKRSGDFGVGWRLDVQSLRLRETGTMGNGWQINLVNQPGPFGQPIPTYMLFDTAAHKVALTLPDGHVEEFDLTPQPNRSPLNPIGEVSLAYSPRPGTLGSLAAVLPNDERYAPSGDTGAVQLIDSDTAVLNPQRYRYTGKDGTVFVIDKTAGVQQVQCTNGVSLAVGPDGIRHDAGPGVAFTRDGQGRITSITDPRGNTQSYGYDGNGDLISHTDATRNTTRFVYDLKHGLIEIQDPRGVSAIRNDYDEAGRLISSTDPLGNTSSFNHDLVARRETVTDRLGNVTVHEYDGAGNVIRTTDPLGGVTLRTYDAFGNEKTRTDPLNRTTRFEYDSRRNVKSETDPLGRVTTYEYNALSQVTKVTDPLLRETINTYDANGNLIGSRDALGNATTYTYDVGGVVLRGTGNLLSKTDALGNVTRYDYDSAGRMIRETDPTGHATEFGYDANGNRTSQTTTRVVNGATETLLTRFDYDENNRLIKTTHPDGSVTQTQYNAIGKQRVTIDALNRQTSYEYDELGRLKTTTYPDSTFESTTYDAEGRRKTSTDRAGHVTEYFYDALGRLTSTVFADGNRTATVYDAAGQVTASEDARRHRTLYGYDEAGRRTKVTDATGAVTEFAYDAVGNQNAVRDANRNTLQFTYDRNNRRTRTDYPDRSFESVTYDELGRQTAKTDQANRTTRYGYDAMGRLTQVTDALGQITRYAYDSLGNQISQTDALGRVTRFAYDKMGRRVSRTLPLGMTETMSYDLTGNLVSKRDFNGRTTTYAYDSQNRLVTKTPDPALGQPQVTFGYYDSGQRRTMTDASGTTSYTYDARDRLVSKITPQGTLSYGYDEAGNLKSISSAAAGGAQVLYTWDLRNRLESVTDGDGTTTYTYDPVGNLTGFLYPNGVQTAYTYNSLNRLTNVSASRGAALASYAYTLGPAGNRTTVTEASGRRAEYTYDELYRLKGETITGDPEGKNGAIGYTYDAVGNRLARSSTLAEIPVQSFVYDNNDRISTESYDANGNTLASGAQSFAYDFENRLTSANLGAVQFVYDGDGNRVAKTVGGVTTRFLVDDRNPTGYAQVLEELSGGVVQKAYTYGLKLISQRQASGVSFYGYDGHGSVRFLTDALGNVTDTYTYDAFGNLISQTGATPNVYLYAGEQTDPALQLQFRRSRYLSVAVGRFLAADVFEGDWRLPMSLQRYAYGENDPVDNHDPSGQSVFVVVRPLDLGPLGFLGRPVFNHVFLAFDSNAGQRTFSFHPKEVCDKKAPRSILSSVVQGLKVLSAENTPCILQDDQIDHDALNRRGKGVGFGLYKVSATSAQEALLLQRALQDKSDINSGQFAKTQYTLLQTNCGGWVDDILSREGLSMPRLTLNLGLGTTFRMGLAPNMGVAISYRFSNLSDFAALIPFMR